MAIPQLSTEQLESARAAATEARRARAQLKDQVKSGALTLSQALDKALEDDVLSRVKVVDLLRALPRVGVTRSQEIPPPAWRSYRRRLLQARDRVHLLKEPGGPGAELLMSRTDHLTAGGRQDVLRCPPEGC